MDFKKEVLEHDGPVLVEFCAPWCGYCRRLAPAVTTVTELYKDKVKVVILNIDDYEALTDSYNIELIPSLILFKKGKKCRPLVNPSSQEDLEKYLKDNGILKD